MRTIIYYHQPTKASEKLKLLLEQELQKIKPEVHLYDFKSSNSTSAKGFTSLPAVKIGDDLDLERAKYKDDKKFIDSVILHLMRRGQVGSYLIVPIDFSEIAENAFANALKLAARTGTAVKLLHIMVDVPQTYNGVILDPDPAIETKRRDHWRETVAFYRKKYKGEIERLDGNLTTEFMVGDPSRKIQELSSDPETQMIILGSREYRADSQTLYDSVIVPVATHARCPVLIIPETTKALEINKIVYGIDEPNMDHKMVDAIRALCGSPHAEVTGVRVLPQKTGSLSNEEELIYKDQEKNLSEVIVYRRNLVACLNEYALERDADLLVVLRKKRAFIERLFHHSTSKEMATSSVVPILIMHEWDPNI